MRRAGRNAILVAMLGEATVQEWQVSSAEEGARLDRFLASKVAHWSRSRLQALIKDGRVEIGGRAQRKSGTTLVAGDRITARLPESQPRARAAQARRLAILFEDEELLVVDKPAGLLTHRGAGGAELSLADMAEAHCGPLPSPQGAERPGIVHRLDRETSGVIVLGKSETGQAELLRQFRRREVQKTYAVLVAGEPRFASDWIEAPLGRNPRHPERISVLAEQDGGRAAATFYEVQERFEGFAHLLCRPKTGRTHQIRVHLCAAGLEVVGDKLYRPQHAKPRTLPEGAPQPRRQMLHALRIEFVHPSTGEPVVFEAPPAADFMALLHWLRESTGHA